MPQHGRKTDRSAGSLVEQGELAEDERLLLESLVQKHVSKHGDEAGRRLWTSGSMEGIPDDLRSLGTEPDSGAGPSQTSRRPLARRNAWIAVLGTGLAALTVGFAVVGYLGQETDRQAGGPITISSRPPIPSSSS